MDDITIEREGGHFRVEGGPLLEAAYFANFKAALRFAREEAGDVVAVILKGIDQ